jgi:hypothetical protein
MSTTTSQLMPDLFYGACILVGILAIFWYAGVDEDDYSL